MKIFLLISFLSSLSFASQWDVELKVNSTVIKKASLDSQDLVGSGASTYEDGSGFEYGLDDKSVLCFYNVEYAGDKAYNLIITFGTIKPKKQLEQLFTKGVMGTPVTLTSGNYSCSILFKN